MPAEAPRCSVAARFRADPMAGTALGYRRWLLLEHPGPWEFDALGGLGLPEHVLGALVAATRETRTRTLLVRRPGRQATEQPRGWQLVDHATRGSLSGPWRRDRDLADAIEAVRTGAPPDEGPARTRLLVCAHGRHDVCCAVEGRPVAAALTEHWPEETWECTHVGGDRFAPNLLVVPDGTWYGGLESWTAARVVRDHLDGVVDPAYLRGFTGQPPVVQVAAVEVHRRFGPGAPGDVVGHRVEPIGDHRWRVELSCTGALPDAVVEVVGHRRDPALLTCQAHVATRAWQWDVVDVTRTSSTRHGEASPGA